MAITDSIHYAYKIQNAVIPSEEFISGILNNYFILYKPRDIVSGDFYWFGKKDDKIIIIAADCTGHGIPVAFMSMLGVAFLNEIDIIPGDILNVFSDGFVDQFGGASGRKFMSKQFKQLLIELQDKPMNEQKTILDKTFEDWKGNNEQIDDVLVMGVMV